MGHLVHVPRMADKARAAQTQTLGDYIFPCPLDNIILEFLGVDADSFLDNSCEDTDAQLLAWVESLCTNRSLEEIEAVNQKILSSHPDSPEKWEIFNKLRNDTDPTRKDVVTWVGLIDLEEGRL